jgi:hypothetical protein
VAGVQGAAGVAGAQGPQGPQGPQGVATPGVQGPAGVQGAQGATGATGTAGAQGPQGAQGPAPAGSPGAAGAQGPQGPTGAPGVSGAQGPQGSQGPAGATGVTGAQGRPGPSGAQGAAGAQGGAGGTVTQINSLGVNTPASGTAGEIRATADITAYYSDQRLKNIKGKVENALQKVSEIRGVSYQSNDLAASYGYKDKSQQIGVLAQEVEKVLPEVIAPAPFDSDKYGKSISGQKYLTVRYERIVPLLVEALKEQKEQINYIKSKL